MTNITETTAVKRLERSRSDRMLAGVCRGLARYFDINPAFYRVGFVVLTLLGGAGILIYAAAALVIPEEGKADSIAAEILRERRERPWQLVGLGLVAVAGAVLLSRATLWPNGDAAWVLALLVGAAILWMQRRRRRGAAMATGDVVEGTRRRPRVLRTAAIVSSVLIVLVLAAAAVTASVFHVHLSDGVGDRMYKPAGAADVHPTYKLGIGDLRVDLGAVPLPPGETDVKARLGIGDLNVVVPRDVALQVKADAQVGAVHVLDREANGRNPSVTINGNGRRVLVLDAHVGLGNLTVTRSVR